MTEEKGIFGTIKNAFKSWVAAPAKPPRSAADILTEIAVDIPTYAVKKLDDLLALSFQGRAEIEAYTGETIVITVTDPEDSGRLIGKDGVTLDALQTLLKAFIFKKFGITLKVTIDTGGYKKRREAQLEAQTMKALNNVLTKGSRASLRPMNAAERRFVHSLIESDKRIRSYSVGDGPYRHIVIERRGGKQAAPPPAA